MAVTCGGGEHSVKSHVVHGEHVRIQLVHSSSTLVPSMPLAAMHSS